MKTSVLVLGWLLALPALACTGGGPVEGTDLVTGKSVSLSADNRPVVAVFLSAVCPCSRSHEGSLKTLAREFPQFAWVGIHSNGSESEEKGRSYFSKADLGFPVIRDRDSRLANAMGALRTPHAFVIGKDNTCLYRGGVDGSHEAQAPKDSFLRRALLSVADGKLPDPRETRVLGCNIDR